MDFKSLNHNELNMKVEKKDLSLFNGYISIFLSIEIKQWKLQIPVICFLSEALRKVFGCP